TNHGRVWGCAPSPASEKSDTGRGACRLPGLPPSQSTGSRATLAAAWLDAWAAAVVEFAARRVGWRAGSGGKCRQERKRPDVNAVSTPGCFPPGIMNARQRLTGKRWVFVTAAVFILPR